MSMSASGSFRFCPHCGSRLVARSTLGGLKRYECPDGPHRAGGEDFRP